MKNLLSIHNSGHAGNVASVAVIAHRGGGALYPENTVAAFRNAVRLGVDALELDIHATSDGEIVVSHDPTIERTTEGAGYISRLTAAELGEFDAGYWWQPPSSPPGSEEYPARGKGHKIPTLKKLFDEFPQMPMVIDIKQRAPDITGPFAELIRTYERERFTYVGSFHSDTLRRFRRTAPAVPTCLYRAEVKRLVYGAAFRVGWLMPMRGQMASVPPRSGGREIINGRFVSAAHRRGIAVSVWTIDSVSEAERLASLGVDSIVTDRPDLMLERFGSTG